MKNVINLGERRSEKERPGFYKYKMKIDKRLDRWFICYELPEEPIYKEWLYFDSTGLPAMYWNVEMNRLILI